MQFSLNEVFSTKNRVEGGVSVNLKILGIGLACMEKVSCIYWVVAHSGPSQGLKIRRGLVVLGGDNVSPPWLR